MLYFKLYYCILYYCIYKMQEINIPSIQSIKSSQKIAEGQVYSFADHICKLDRILRMFRMVKSNDASISSEVQKRVKTIME